MIKKTSEGKQRVCLHANQCHRQILKYLKYWNRAGTERTSRYYWQVDVINKAFQLFLLYNKWVEIVRANFANRCYVAVTLRQTLSCLRRNFGRRRQDVNRDKTTSFLAPLHGRQVAQTPRKWLLPGECARPVQNSLSREWTIVR